MGVNYKTGGLQNANYLHLNITTDPGSEGLLEGELCFSTVI